MKLSIIIPVFNEEKYIEADLKKLNLLNLGRWKKEIIIVDDGSKDDSLKIIFKIIPGLSLPIKFLKHDKNLGKGAAIRTALKETTGEAIIIQDADLEYDPAEWPAMLKELESGQYQAVYGSRNLAPKRKGYLHYVFGDAVLTALTNILFRSHLTDVYTGAKLFRAEVLKNLNLESNGFEFEAEVTAKILKSGGKIKEIPISYYPRSFKEGKKIRWKDGLVGMWTIIKNRYY